MRVFITGATGVLGRGTIPSLLAQGHKVTAAGRSPERLSSLARLGADTVSLDIFDKTAAQRAMTGHDAVINLATHVPSPNRMFLPGAWKEMDRIRRTASATLAQAAIAAGVPRFVQESFAPIYKDNGDEWITEDSPVRPAWYNRTVLNAEASAEQFHYAGGTAVVLRFALLYGPGDPFANTMLEMVRRGRMPLVGRREAFASMVTHHDAAAAVATALTLPDGTYDVVDDMPMRREALGNALAAMLGVAPPKFFPPWMAKLGGSLGETIARSLRISNGKLRIISNWVPQYPDAVVGFRSVLGALRRETVRESRQERHAVHS